MNDPTPHDPAPASGSPEPRPVSHEAALELVGQVIAWYRRQIQAERRAPEPDQERLAALAAGEREAAKDETALEDAPEGADAAQISRIAARYAALLEELTGQ
ncbi:hypothetical protein [Streptomyces candidus]|uniref:Uncharacterized protein n=1 Tax=Streptomyces candidus TaxID=67283 RepID=A0A7X0LRV5_9ACTN|nr:hypothetical protein [Streptomyces candidus]MBB6439033.1 hypothetical protein [Streptomyces candidus]GHH55398.1 hypothetical protein GCM10018773_59720 [Streptomyces candidus]